MYVVFAFVRHKFPNIISFSLMCQLSHKVVNESALESWEICRAVHYVVAQFLVSCILQQRAG